MSRVGVEVGSTANRYQLLAKLATGGMAEIFLARGEAVAGVERYCVLKRILRDRAGEPHFIRMFLDEMRLAAQLQHPNIAQVYDIGELGDSYFFTMEYVHGETVRALLHRAQGLRRKLPLGCVLTIAAGAAAGLHHAHTRLGIDGRALGIVHRDVSPSNLMVSYEGSVKVVDFGVAKAADRAQETRSGTVKGKIGYLSPEQCKGKRVDRRSDLFSLGICVWEMLTTERLFKRTSDFENMNAIVTEATPPPSSRRPDVPSELDALVLRLLAKTPEQRFQTANELVEAIEDVASRTRSLLSASALGRFLRELFGPRPEPWLELESPLESGEVVTVTSESIPRELVSSTAHDIDHPLASVVGPGARAPVTESLDPFPRKGSPPWPGPRTTLELPLAAPPPSQLRIAPLAEAPTTPPQPPPARTMTIASAAPPPPRSGRHADSLWSPSPVPPSSEAVMPSSGRAVVPAWAVGPRSAFAATPSGSRAMASGPFMAPSSAEGAMQVSAWHRARARRRAAWPRFAVIGGAALLGSIAGVIILRSSPGAGAVGAARIEGPSDANADEIAQAFAEARYDKVMALCGPGPVTAEHAPMCFLAACHAGSEAKARRWIIAAPAGQREPLTTSCQQLGIDVTLEHTAGPARR